MKHPKRDVYMETTEKIVELLEAGRIPWQKARKNRVPKRSSRGKGKRRRTRQIKKKLPVSSDPPECNSPWGKKRAASQCKV